MARRDDRDQLQFPCDGRPRTDARGDFCSDDPLLDALKREHGESRPDFWWHRLRASGSN